MGGHRRLVCRLRPRVWGPPWYAVALVGRLRPRVWGPPWYADGLVCRLRPGVWGPPWCAVTLVSRLRPGAWGRPWYAKALSSTRTARSTKGGSRKTGHFGIAPSIYSTTLLQLPKPPSFASSATISSSLKSSISTTAPRLDAENEALRRKAQALPR